MHSKAVKFDSLLEGPIAQWIGNEEVATVSPGQGLLRWDASNGDLELAIPVTQNLVGDWSPDGDKVVARGVNLRNTYAAILVFNGNSGEIITEIRTGSEPIIRANALINADTNEVIKTFIILVFVDLTLVSAK